MLSIRLLLGWLVRLALVETAESPPAEAGGRAGLLLGGSALSAPRAPLVVLELDLVHAVVADPGGGLFLGAGAASI